MRLDVLLRGYGDVVGQLVDQTGQPLTFDFEPSLSVTHSRVGTRWRRLFTVMDPLR